MYTNISNKLKEILTSDLYIKNSNKLSSTIQWNKELQNELFELTNFLVQDEKIRLTTLGRVYCILNDIHEQPICKHCGKPVGFIGWQRGFRDYCSNSCQRQYYERYIITDELDKKRKKNASIAHKQTYINNPNLGKEISNKRLETWYNYPIERRQQQADKWKQWYYGMSSDERAELTNKRIESTKRFYKGKNKHDIFVKNGKKIWNINDPYTIKTKNERHVNTCLVRFNTVNSLSSNSPIREKINYKEIGKKNALIYKNKPIEEKIKYKQKEYQTKLKNKTFSGPISKQELILLNRIKTLYPQYTIIQQYGDERYPFICDFYIKELDLFIEYQGSQFHQDHPYDPNNEDDNNLANHLLELYKEHGKYYKAMHDNWTIKDVIKRNTAKENKINFEEIWNYKISDDEIKRIISKYETKK